MKKTHILKAWPIFFRGLPRWNKTAEVRKNDRDFQPGDILVLKEWSNFGYSGRVEERVISNVDDLSSLGLENQVLLSFDIPEIRNMKTLEAECQHLKDDVEALNKLLEYSKRNANILYFIYDEIGKEKADKWHQELIKQQIKIKRLEDRLSNARIALNFYSKKENYRARSDDQTAVMLDFGSEARKALDGINARENEW